MDTQIDHDIKAADSVLKLDGHGSVEGFLTLPVLIESVMDLYELMRVICSNKKGKIFQECLCSIRKSSGYVSNLPFYIKQGGIYISNCCWNCHGKQKMFCHDSSCTAMDALFRHSMLGSEQGYTP